MSATESRSGSVRLAVDHDLCSGTGHCQGIAPDVFRVRDQRAWLAEGFDVTFADPDRLRRAAAACPWYAITYQSGELDDHVNTL